MYSLWAGGGGVRFWPSNLCCVKPSLEVASFWVTVEVPVDSVIWPFLHFAPLLFSVFLCAPIWKQIKQLVLKVREKRNRNLVRDMEQLFFWWALTRTSWHRKGAEGGGVSNGWKDDDLAQIAFLYCKGRGFLNFWRWYLLEMKRQGILGFQGSSSFVGTALTWMFLSPFSPWITLCG